MNYNIFLVILFSFQHHFQISQTFSFRQLQSWLRSNLQVNPFGVSAILAHGLKQQETLVESMNVFLKIEKVFYLFYLSILFIYLVTSI